MQIYCGCGLSETDTNTGLGKLIDALAYSEEQDLRTAGFRYQHLHLISERPFEDGDYIWVPNRLSGEGAKQVLYGQPYVTRYVQGITNMLHHREAKKIEATTDRTITNVLGLGSSIISDYFQATKRGRAELSAIVNPDTIEVFLIIKNNYYSFQQ